MDQVLYKSLYFFFFFCSGTLPHIVVVLMVQDVTPLSGSVLGGTVITITGRGFGTDNNKVDVKIGGHDCLLTKVVTNTEIVCQIAETADTEIITNLGTTGKCKLITLGKIFSRSHFEIFFLFFPQTGFDISCKLTPSLRKHTYTILTPLNPFFI